MNITPEQARAELERRGIPYVPKQKENTYGITADQARDEIVRRQQNAPSSLEDAVKGIVGKAVDEALMKKGSLSRDVMSDPVTQAKALPELAGTAASLMAPIPMAATAATVPARQLSNLALKTYGKENEIPSAMAQGGEAVLSVLGDLTAVPAYKASKYGKEIGIAEQAAGVPQFPESLKRPGGAAATTKWIDETRRAVGNGEIAGDEPVILKQIKDQIDFIYKNKKDVPLSNADEGKLAALSNWVRTSLNKAVPGRAEPAADMARSLAVNNYIGNSLRKIPAPVKYGLGVGAGTTTGAGLAYELGKKIFGSK